MEYFGISFIAVFIYSYEILTNLFSTNFIYIKEIFLKENVLCAIKVFKENKKRPDCQSICYNINKITDWKTVI